MKITTKHKDSKFGVPVILNDAGDVMNQRDGLAMVKEKLGFKYHVLAFLCGTKTRTFEGWAQGRPMPASALIVLAEELEKKEETK